MEGQNITDMLFDDLKSWNSHEAFQVLKLNLSATTKDAGDTVHRIVLLSDARKHDLKFLSLSMG